MSPVARRRTQVERREATIRKLLDAATATLIEDGYAAASVQQICARAGVSQGGLFRHFATREALMVAVGEDVGEKLLEHYRGEFETLREREDPILLAMRLVRDACGSRLNQAWYELTMAARTSPALRKKLAPIGVAYHDAIIRLAAELLPDVAAKLGDRFPVLVGTIIAVFDGEVLHRTLVKQPIMEAARLDLLTSFARLLTA